jgi:hypothetical protein
MKINEFRKETKPNINRPPSMQDIRSRQNCTAAIVTRKGHTVQDSSFECPSRGSIRCLIYLIWETLHHHGIFGSNARGGVLVYVDHCFGTSRVPYLSLIFLLRYIVGSPLFLVIHGSKLTGYEPGLRWRPKRAVPLSTEGHQVRIHYHHRSKLQQNPGT